MADTDTDTDTDRDTDGRFRGHVAADPQQEPDDEERAEEGFEERTGAHHDQEGGGAVERHGRDVSSLQTARGSTSISDDVVAKIASLAAREVDDVADLGGTLSGALATVVGRIRGEDHQTAGVGVEVGTRQAAVDLSLTIRYPAPIMEVAQQVRERVIERIESMTGLEVVEVNVAVVDLRFEGPGAPGAVRVE